MANEGRVAGRSIRTERAAAPPPPTSETFLGPIYLAQKASKPAKPNDTAANLGFEAKLWQMADGLPNNMDAAEYKHVVLRLIFLKYISDVSVSCAPRRRLA